MTHAILTAAVTLVAASAIAHAQAQGQAPSFDTAAYMTCRDAQNMPVEPRKQLAIFLAEHSARYHGVSIPDDEQGARLALLVRGGCTLAPDAYLFTVIDRAIVAELSKLPKRQ
jgi:hypothetical protein